MGEKVTYRDGEWEVPDNPTIGYIQGDGTGVDITPVALKVLNAAVDKAYGQERTIDWKEVYVGQKGKEEKGELLPESSLKEIENLKIVLKGPLTTPVGAGYRSLNVALRQHFDLYANLRPVLHFDGVPSPVTDPEKVDFVIFRENIEDVYAGIEWESGSQDAKDAIEFVRGKGFDIREDSGIGIKPISPFGSKRLVRAAMEYALDKGRESVTLVHKGNIMKHTEGAFKDWGYELIREEYEDEVVFEEDLQGEIPDDKILVKNRIADNMLQQILLRPGEYDVIATTNLNGDYLSDAAAAQSGSLGMAPGANLGEGMAIFEPVHGTAPKYAGMDKVNPTAIILSGRLLLEEIGWQEAADLIIPAIQQTIQDKKVTYDLERQMEGAELLKCSEFGEEVINNL